MPLDPVALAALEALSESDSESSSSSTAVDDDANANDDHHSYLDVGSSNYDCSNTSYESDDMDDYSPIIKKGEIAIAPSEYANSSSGVSSKKRRISDSNASNAIMDNIQRNTGISQQSQARYPLSHLKPFFDVGTAVYGPWWTGSVRKEFCDQWFPGIIASYKEVPSSSPYGPLRLYTIQYDDGDILEDVHDHFVFSKDDYLLHDRPLRGVRCEADTGFADDKWANFVGWYVVAIDGVDVRFSTLADAMDAYDNHFIQQKGANVKPSNLNRPERYPSLVGSSRAKTKTRTPRSESSTSKSRSSPPPGTTSSLASTTPKSASLSNKKLPSSLSSSSESSSISPKTASRNRLDKTSREPWSSPSTTETAPAPRKRLKKKYPESESSVVTHKIATRKHKKKSPPPASNYQGVTYSKDDKKYVAQIEYRNQFHSLGLYKFEADAALAYDIGCKLLWKHHKNNDIDGAEAARAIASSHSKSAYNFVWRESYDESIQKEMAGANRKRINADKSYSEVSKMVEGYLSKIFVALEPDSPGDDHKELDFTMNDNDNYTRTQFELTDSAPITDSSSVDIEENGTGGRCDSENASFPSSPCNMIMKETDLCASSDKNRSGDDDKDGTNYDGTEMDFSISPPIMDTSTVNDSIERNVTTSRLRDDEDSVSSSQFETFKGKHDYYCVEYDKVKKCFVASITLPKTEAKAEIKYWLGEYKLEVDAALACDKAATLLQVETLANFSTMEEYEDAKEKELDRTKCSDVDSMSSTEIATQVFDSILDRMNNVLAKKWEKYLQATKNRSDFLDSYQTSIRNILTGKDLIPGIIRSEECCDDEREKINDNANGKEGEDSDDNASLFSNSSQMTPQGCL